MLGVGLDGLKLVRGRKQEREEFADNSVVRFRKRGQLADGPSRVALLYFSTANSSDVLYATN